MLRSDDINEIAAALSVAQGIIKNPAKTRINPHFKSRYADLADGLDCIRPALSANGIAIVQAPEITRDWVFLDARLIHSSGQYLGCIYPVGPVTLKHQELGAALTYARRQSAFTLVGVVGDDDLDGEDSKDVKAGNGSEARVTEEQIAAIRELITDQDSGEQRLLKYLRVGSLSVLPAADYQRAVDALTAKRATK